MQVKLGISTREFVAEEQYQMAQIILGKGLESKHKSSPLDLSKISISPIKLDSKIFFVRRQSSHLT